MKVVTLILFSLIRQNLQKFFISSILFLILACGKQVPHKGNPEPSGKISSGPFELQEVGIDKIPLSEQTYLPIFQFGGKEYIEIEGILSHEIFNRLNLSTSTTNQRLFSLKKKLLSIRKNLHEQTPLVQVAYQPEVGYFSALVSLEKLNDRKKFRHASSILKELFPNSIQDNEIVLSPIVRSSAPNPFYRIPEMPFLSSSSRSDELPMNFKSFFPSIIEEELSQDGHSGLSLMKVPEFIQIVESELNPQDDAPIRPIRINGSKVRIGITDTGITLGHPTFMDDEGKSRIVYMKDFTGEGRVYFNPQADFTVRLPDDRDSISPDVDKQNALFLSAEIIPPTKGINRPTANEFLKIENKLIQVSAELKSILTTPGSGAKLGALSESSFGNEEDKVDLNQNGKTEDLFWLIYIPAKDEQTAKVFLDTSSSLDFRKALVLSDWNTTGSTVVLHSEKFGFSFDLEELPLSPKSANSEDNGDVKSDEDQIQTQKVASVSIVGFDPGNHGTHVAGIAAGKLTISNDLPQSLARGVAPGAQIFMNRVCANNGGCISSKAIIDMAKQGVDLINMSLGGLSHDNDGFDAQSVLIDRLIQLYQVQFFISAGNSGPGHQTVGSPSVSRLGISVGAAATPAMMKRQLQFTAFPPFKMLEKTLDKDGIENEEGDFNKKEFMLYFSSRGPTAAGGFKPDLVAPGSQLSAIPFNIPPKVTQAGLASYWGTSMAAPAASGAYSLLLDAARKYNQLHPQRPLPTAPLILRHILLESARPFSLKRANGPQIGNDYTWIDQGMGMIDLPHAWELLKQARGSLHNPTFFVPQSPSLAIDTPNSGTASIPVILDYEVKVNFEKNRNGLPYKGEGEVPKYGRGLWIDFNSSQSLYPVSIKRNLPQDLLQRTDAQSLLKVLRDTSGDDFKIRITPESSSDTPSQNWLKITDFKLPCFNDQERGKETVHIGSMGENSWSNIYVCLHRGKIKSLPPGDHGLLIKGYRTRNGFTDPFASFVIPLYLTVPHKVLADTGTLPTEDAGNSMETDNHDGTIAPHLDTPFEVNGTVRSFEVKRHYIDVPKGTSMVKLTLEVPKAHVSSEGDLQNCSGVNFIVHEGMNVKNPNEIKGKGKASVKSCDDGGSATPDQQRIISFQRMNPNPGIWDLHVLGLFRYPFSAYNLKVDYGRLGASIQELNGPPSILDGKIKIDVQMSTFPLLASPKNGQFFLNALRTQSPHKIQAEEKLTVPGSRQFDSSITQVAFKIGEAKGDNIDLDLYLYECQNDLFDPNGKECEKVGEGTSATAEEEIKLTPKKDKFYFVQIEGFTVPKEGTEFVFKETHYLKDEDRGRLEYLSNNGKILHFHHQMPHSRLLEHPLFISGKWSVLGEIQIRTEDNSLIALFPVTITSL